MCGICGVYQERPDGPTVLEEATARMTAALVHRGPDDEGVWADPRGRVALGNRRLAIIDLSPAGHQPMADAGGEVVLTYNGEIYNFRDLRRELEASGYPFGGHSDTEVILALYLRDGLDAVERLRGMFALAIWDARSERLVLARDRLGIKPLYYAQERGRWVFASEIRGIRASGLVSTQVDPVALAAYLRLGSVPGPVTAFQGVREVPPATMVVLTPAGESRRSYWELPRPGSGQVDPDEAAAELRHRLSDAVTSHLVSDVPLGVFLSGGMDSGALVAMMREAGHARIRTFSITFPDAAFDEGPDAARLAARYETEHTGWEVRGGDVARDLDAIVEAMDQPTIDGMNTYYVSRVTRRSGTIVALSGLGGDELFYGYPSFRLAPRILAWQRLAARVPAAGQALAAVLSAVPSGRSAKLREGLRARPGILSAYLAVRGLFSGEELRGLLRPGPVSDAARTLDTAGVLSALAPDLPDDAAAATGVLELRSYMHNQLLRDTDVMSMVHSLEVRVPFLDHPLVEFAAALPPGFQANGHPPKWLLLRALGERLPPEATQAKRGFTFPLGRWIQGALRPRVDEALRDGDAIFDPRGVSQLWGRVQAGRVHWSRVWALAVLALWLRKAESRVLA